MEPGKVQLVQHWPTTASRKEVHQYLGFANCYRIYFGNFCHIVAASYALTSSEVWFSRFSKAELAFKRLKCSVVSAPVMVLQTWKCSLWWRWMPQIWDLKEYSLHGLKLTASSIHMSFCPKSCCPAERNVGDFEELAVKRSGGTVWKGRNSLSWFELIIRTIHILKLLNGWIHIKPGGQYSFHDLLSSHLLDNVQRISNLMHCRGNLMKKVRLEEMRQLSRSFVFLVVWLGELRNGLRELIKESRSFQRYQITDLYNWSPSVRGFGSLEWGMMFVNTW